MDFVPSFKVFVVVLVLIINISHGSPWYKSQEDLDSLHNSYFTETLINGVEDTKRSFRIISKRSADWSNRQSPSSLLSLDFKPEPQESEHIEMTSKLPKIIRKVRLQNVPINTKHFDQKDSSIGRNNTTVFDKQGRIVRIKKFRRRTTTANPSLMPKFEYTTTTAPTPSPSRSITLPMEYSHITVINKEYVDQKPKRKQRSKNKTRLWVPTASYGERTTQKEINDVTPSLYPEETEAKKQRFDGPYSKGAFEYKSSRTLESGAIPNQKTQSNLRNENQEGTLKLNTENLNEPYTSRSIVKEIEKERFSQRPQHNSQRLPQIGTIDKMKRVSSRQAVKLSSVSDTTPIPPAPKSVEVPSDVAHNQNNPILQTIPPGDLNLNNTTDHEKINMESPPQLFGGEWSSHSPFHRPSGKVLQNNAFGQQFPREINPIFQGYADSNSYFRSQQPQLLEMHNSQNDNPLLPPNFQQPFSPYYRSKEQRIPDYFSSPLRMTSYHRSGQLGRPEFYSQLASLRRSVIDTYSEEESKESTTEFSIPKFEVPSIDFSDKGCRTAYKEVSAIPTDGFNERTQESKAKSFIMTRECFFPDGVPTTKSVEDKEQVKDVTPLTKEV
ncbi:uncharacterized protein NPIL_218601 [Nephila pilipes]|uniref:Uncharacterized protein n=1 Tax=Nephila pilipes TaxID=299642 RepID=A0A8X6JSN2_NEPPI|nr:uncharacterized protein NPIL_218601 [Nephila pilipes]